MRKEAERRGRVRNRRRDSDLWTLVKLWLESATGRERRESKQESCA